MTREQTVFDLNLERLIRAACGAEARPTPATRRRLRRRLSAVLSETRPPREFPAGILALLGGLILLSAAAGFLSGRAAGVRLPLGIALNPASLMALVNLAALPIASLVIVIRRKLWPNA